MLGITDKWMKRFSDRLVENTRAHGSTQDFKNQLRNTVAAAVYSALRAGEFKGHDDMNFDEVKSWVDKRKRDKSDVVKIAPNTTTTFSGSYDSMITRWSEISDDYNKIRDERIQESWADIAEKGRAVLLRFTTVLATGIAAIFIFLLATWLNIEIPLLKLR